MNKNTHTHTHVQVYLHKCTSVHTNRKLKNVVVKRCRRVQQPIVWILAHLHTHKLTKL